MDVETFVAKWGASGGAERANYQLFLAELCDVLDVPRPDPTVPDDAHKAHVFEKAVTFCHGDGTTSAGRIDLYRRGSSQRKRGERVDVETFVVKWGASGGAERAN